MIKFIKTQDNGDATSNYDIEFPEGMTIKDFIQQVRKEQAQDWRGTFYYNNWWKEIGGYHNEMWLVDDLHANIVPFKIRASGGYGLMDYYFIDRGVKE